MYDQNLKAKKFAVGVHACRSNKLSATRETSSISFQWEFSRAADHVHEGLPECFQKVGLFGCYLCDLYPSRAKVVYFESPVR